jgi:hypothetical protein
MPLNTNILNESSSHLAAAFAGSVKKKNAIGPVLTSSFHCLLSYCSLLLLSSSSFASGKIMPAKIGEAYN